MRVAGLQAVVDLDGALPRERDAERLKSVTVSARSASKRDQQGVERKCRFADGSAAAQELAVILPCDFHRRVLGTYFDPFGRELLGIRARNFAERISAFDGKEPVLRQSPPIRCFSISATFAINTAAMYVTIRQAEPVPMTIRL